MDIKGLTTQITGKSLDESNVIKPSVASSDHAPHSGTQLSPQTIKAIQAMLQGLQLGKVFDVIVTRVEGSVVTLQIPGSSSDTPVLQAEMKSPPPLGTRLTLQLTDDVNHPELKVIATPNSPQDAVSRNLRVNLQQQKPLPPLLANLAHVAKNTSNLPDDLPVDIIETVRQVIQQIPSSNKVSVPQGLKQALQQTGPYLEASLARHTLPDVKTSHMPLPEQYVNADITKVHKETENVLQPSKQVRYDMASQTLQLMSRAMQEQPVQDVRANLLRLATVIRAAADLYRLQKSAFQNVKTADATKVHIPDATKVHTPDATKAHTPGAKPSPIPLPASLTESKPITSDKPASPINSPKPANDAMLQVPPQNPAVRSQTPHAQAQAQSTLVNMTNAESAMDELLGQIEGALTRIQVQQLQTAATDQQHRPVWVMELPVRTEQGIDLFDIRIQRDKENHAEDDPAAPWTVSLAFDLDKLGAIRAKISLYGEDKVSTTFWAEHSETSTYFNQHLDKLESRLKQVGLDVAKLDCRCGKPDAPPPSAEPRLVDEKV